MKFKDFSMVFQQYQLVQIGAKFMFIAGMFISGCVTILFGFLHRAPDGPIFIGLCFLVRGMDAIGFAAAATASFSILINAFPQNVATVMGILEVFTGLGLVLGPPIGGFLYQSFGYEVPFIALGSVMLCMVPLNMVILPNYSRWSQYLSHTSSYEKASQSANINSINQSRSDNTAKLPTSICREMAAPITLCSHKQEAESTSLKMASGISSKRCQDALNLTSEKTRTCQVLHTCTHENLRIYILDRPIEE
uniref:Major facilitator superfamily (MFS) profile domain-containing protein n=1 Tax=Laticauda laticaudata TaxID=8630 RepID=A0A8C5SFZ0_LATLA